MSDLNEILTLLKKKNCLLTRVYSAVKLKTANPEWSAKQNQVLCKESAEAVHRTTEAQEAMDRQLQARQAEAKLRDMCESNSTQAQTLAASQRESELEHQQLHTANERRLQLEAPPTVARPGTRSIQHSTRA